MKNKRTTMLDVARLAGVSYQTVSRVLNTHPNVAPETRDRVLRIIDEMKYRPSQAARSLAARRSQSLAVITYTMQHYGPTQMIANIDRFVREAGYDLIVVHVDPLSSASMDAAVDRILRWSADGVLMIAPIKNAYYLQLVDEFANTPLIQIDIAPGSATPSVIVDQREGSRLMTQLLLDSGHRRICEISGPLDWFGAMARHQGMRDALGAIEPVASIAGDWTAESGYSAMTALLNRQDLAFTALVIGNDQMALGAMSALRERGLHVPDDISIGGYDDIPEAAYFSPALTTVRQDFSELARQGVTYLIDLIEESGRARGQQVIAPQLIQRQSIRILR